MIAGAAALHLRRGHESPPIVPQTIASVSASTTPPLEIGAGPLEAPFTTRMQHGGPARRHRASGRGPRRAEVGWSQELGAAVEAQIVTSPDGATLYALTLGGELIAMDARDGSIRWRRSEGNRMYGTPFVMDDGLVVLGRDGGAVVAYNAEGVRKFRLEAEHDCDVALAYANGALLTACGPAVRAIGLSGTLLGEALLPKKVYSTLAVHDGVVTVGAQDGRVRALRLPGLSPMWDTKLGADVDGGVAIADDGSVVVGTDAGEVVRLSRAGAIQWRRKVGAYVRGPLSIARNGDVLAGVMGKEPGLVRLEPTQGEPRFHFATGGSGAVEFGVRGGALEDDAGTLYFGAQDDLVYALESNGALIFRYDMGADVDAPLTLLNDGRLIVAADNGRITCLLP